MTEKNKNYAVEFVEIIQKQKRKLEAEYEIDSQEVQKQHWMRQKLKWIIKASLKWLLWGILFEPERNIQQCCAQKLNLVLIKGVFSLYKQPHFPLG